MISTMNRTVPFADLLGRGGADVRTGGLTVAGPVAPFQGTGASAANRRRVCLLPNERFIAPTYLPQHDGTTLGIQSPGRPQS